MTLPFQLNSSKGYYRADITIREAILAGWTGRDRAALEKHIEEMAAVGVRRPPSVPVFYRCSASRLTTADEIQVVGEDSSGEVEFVLIRPDPGGRNPVGRNRFGPDRPQGRGLRHHGFETDVR